MCRLFGQHAHPDLDRSDALCSAHNALRFQSHKHPHGWGIAWYRDGAVEVRRGLLPAHADDAFVAAGREARSQVVVAHVRDASVGPVATENTHPFVHGRWVFAHNGTVARYRRSEPVRQAIEAEIDPGFRRLLEGDTDSERCFFLLLTRLAARTRLDRATLLEVDEALTEVTRTVQRIADVPSAKPSALNFLVSDGRLLAARRLGRDLHVSTAAGPERAFVVASEPIGHGGWTAVPDGSFVGFDGEAYSSPWIGKPRG
ncbi:MAG TPA: class II glutamine amidotransferase [Anaeromyxobacteraceae bacterium]|nr:class II glutamine amidotransferase [Anaeromyxobacteraceae bacterium]